MRQLLNYRKVPFANRFHLIHNLLTFLQRDTNPRSGFQDKVQDSDWTEHSDWNKYKYSPEVTVTLP